MEALIIPTFNCQLKCRHCFLPEALRKKSVLMEDSEYEFILKKVQEMQDVVNDYGMLFIISGGEPLTVGVKQMGFYLESIRKHFGKVPVNVNTNLLFYNREFGRLFVEYDVEVEASYDPVGVRFVNHEMEREWERKFKNALNDGVKIRVAITLTRKVLTFDLFRFAEKLGTRHYNMSHFCPLGRGWKNRKEFYVTKKELAFYIMGVLHFQDLFEGLDIHPWKDFPENYHSGGAVDCWGECYNCFAFTPGGDVYFSGFCYSRHPLGNLYRDSLHEILFSEKRVSFIRWKLTRPECIQCEHHFFCRGGCFSLSKVVEDKTTCPGLKPLLDFLSMGRIPEELEGEFYRFIKNSTWMGKYL